jgi:peroxidase
MYRMRLSTASVALLFAGISAQPSPVANAAQATPAPATSSTSSSTPALLREFRPIGGSGNNLTRPSFNATPGSPELKIAPLNFARGTQNGLVDGPNARTVSNVIAGGTGANGQNAETEDPTASAWLYVFGQFVDHDLDLEATPPTNPAIDITVPPGDPVFKAGTSIALTRATRSPSTNTLVNTVAGYLDLSQLYGSTVEIAASLRNADGTLKSSNSGKALSIANGAFVTGDPRVMENPELSAVTVLFMREHNYRVGQLKAQHPTWSGDQLYNMARAITTAEYQNIIYTEYLPVLIGQQAVGQYRGYNPATNAQVTQEFSTAAFRVGHSEISDTQTGLDNSGNVTFTESLAQAFFNTAEQDVANGIDALLRSVGADSSEATDVYTVDTLRNLLFAPLVGGDVDEVDLIAIDIQRERDAGLGTLNQTRRALGLSAYTSFSQLTNDRVLQKSFADQYGSIDRVDLFMGGLAENHVRGAVVGETFQAIIQRQFAALRDGDRFFWANQKFDERTSAMIADSTLGQLLKRGTDTVTPPVHAFVLSAPASSHPHAPAGPVDNHGRRGIPFILP